MTKYVLPDLAAELGAPGDAPPPGKRTQPQPPAGRA